MFDPKRQRLSGSLNLDLIDPHFLDGSFDTPEVFRDNANPQKLVPFNLVKTFRGDKSRTGVHFFLDDYQFERVWNQPERYAKMLAGFACVTTPDFSMFTDMPRAAQIWNHYRKMAVGQFLQSAGIPVVPTLNWSTPESFRFCFDGMPEGGTVAVSSVGCCKNQSVRECWILGMNEAVRRLRPARILFYGSPIEFLNENAEVVHFRPEHLEKVRAEAREVRAGGGRRTQFLAENPALIRAEAGRLGIPKGEWDDFAQEVLMKSLELPDDFDPKRAKISTWATGFVRLVGMNYRKKINRQARAVQLSKTVQK